MNQPEIVFSEALNRHKVGDIVAAADLYAQTISMNPGHLGALFNLAALHAALGDADEAGALYRQVLEISPEDPDALSNYGNLLQTAGEADDAEEYYRRAIECDPSHAAAHSNLGSLYLAQDRLDDAETQFRLAVEIAPTSTSALAGLGSAVSRLGNAEKAKAVLTKAVQIDPKDPDVLNNLANVLTDTEDYEAALEHYQEAIALRPSWPEAHYNRGVLHDKLKQREKAKQSFRTAVALKADYAKALCRLGELEAEDGELEEAERHLRAGAELTELPSEAEFHLGTLHHFRGEYEKAIEHFLQSVALDDSLPEVWNNLGNSYMENGQNEEAEDAFLRALALNGDFAHVHNNMGKLCRSRQDLDGAEREYRTALELDPKSSVAASNLGSLLVERGEYVEARKWFDLVMELDPSHSAYNGLGMLYQSMNDQKEAIKCFKTALELEPKSAEVLNNMAISYQSLGKYDEAARYYNMVFDVKPEQDEAYVNLANMLLSQSLYDEAVLVFRKAKEVNPENRGIYPYLAHAMTHQCNWDNLQSVTELVIQNTEEELENGWPVCATPFGLLSLPTTVDLRARVSNNVAEHIEEQVRPTREANTFEYSIKHKGKLKVGFMSPDFRSHSVALLFNGIAEHYDRDRFEFHGYMLSSGHRDNLTQFFREKMDSFTDFKEATLLEAARKVNEDGIHVLVDLAGHTRGAWPQLFALHPAPVQASAIGYASTIGGGLMDYLITDETLWPEYEQQHCSEKLVYLPHTSMPGSPREIAKEKFSRTEMGLPEEGIVFVNFNGHYKFDPETFGTWVRILKRVPGSVLWLMQGSSTSRENLLREAANRGLDEGRIIFADNLMQPYHMSRLQLADIALDCFFHVGGATTLDALWAGVPVIVTHGTNVSNRTGRNLLEVCQMPELIGATIRDVENIAVGLALDPGKLAAVKAKLSEKVKTTPLFNIELFTRHFEGALQAMWENHEAGNEPRHLHVPPLEASDPRETVQ